MSAPASAERVVTVTVGRGAQCSVGLERRTMSLEALLTRLHTHEVTEKEDAECIIPGAISECPASCRNAGRSRSVDCGGGRVHRLADNVQTVEALFLDFDGWSYAQLADALQRVRESGYRFLCYSSWSYAPPEKAKVRIVFPLAAPYAVEDARHWRSVVWPALVRAVGLPDADRACADVSRLYYLPSVRTADAPRLVQEGGERLLEATVAPLSLVLSVPTRPASGEELIAQLRAAVDFPPDVELVERIADGAPLAEVGDRHAALLRATWLLAALRPRPTPESVEAVLAASCAAMGDERDFLGEAVRCYETAEPEVDSPEAADWRARLEEQAGTTKAFAQRLARECAGEARFLPGVGWHLWTGARFAAWGGSPGVRLTDRMRPGYEADLAQLRGRITEIDEQLRGMVPGPHAATLATKRNALSERADKFYARVIRPTQESSSAAAIIREAENLDTFRTEPDAFDADPWTLNVANGLLDLRTGALRAHDPAALCAKLAPVAYRPDAQAPLFERALSDALPDPEVRGLFQRVVGYALTGDTSEHLMFLLLGSGGNGKSTLLNAIAAVLGDYAGTAPKSLLMHGGRFATPRSHELAALKGMRFGQLMELNERERLDSSRLKSVVGGDRITADRKYEHEMTFACRVKILMACNELPRITDDDQGAWRRVAVIEFPNAFLTDDKRDRTLPGRLHAESEGILAWAVRGCLEWVRWGLRVPAACVRRVEEYRHEENDVLQWAEWLRAERGAGGMMSSDLYRTYTDWAAAAQVHPKSLMKWGRRLKALGFISEHTRAGSRWTWMSQVSAP